MLLAVMIGIGPHNGSYTAVAVGPSDEPLGRQRVRACPDQARQLLAWAAAWPERTWAVEGATGLGRMLARQLAAAGEQVLDNQPKLAARVRLLEAGDVNRNDPNDARAGHRRHSRGDPVPQPQPLPGLTPAYVPRQRSRRASRRRRKPGEPLDNDDNKEDSICAEAQACQGALGSSPSR